MQLGGARKQASSKHLEREVKTEKPSDSNISMLSRNGGHYRKTIISLKTSENSYFWGEGKEEQVTKTQRDETIRLFEKGRYHWPHVSRSPGPA